MSHIYENPLEREVDLIAIISSVCVNIQNQTRCICAPTHWTFSVTSTITMKLQTASTTAVVNYSMILQL